jgi:hypothetical protein
MDSITLYELSQEILHTLGLDDLPITLRQLEDVQRTLKDAYDEGHSAGYEKGFDDAQPEFGDE